VTARRRHHDGGVWLLVAGALLAAPHLGPIKAPAAPAAHGKPATVTVAPAGRVLAADPHIRSASAAVRADLASGRLDPRVRAVLAAIARRHRVTVSCIHSGHAKYVHHTRRVSNHWVWRAVDIGAVDGQLVRPTSPAARALVAWLGTLPGALRPAEIGSPFPMGGRPWFTDADHHDHIHVGYGARR
jgi:hypothetical protein